MAKRGREKQHRHEKHKPKPKPKHRPKPPARKPARGKETERIKETAHGRGQGQGEGGGGFPQDPADDQAVFTTGPGQAVEYRYVRQGTYADEYAQQDDLQQYVTAERAPAISGPGQVYTGAANNPT